MARPLSSFCSSPSSNVPSYSESSIPLGFGLPGPQRLQISCLDVPCGALLALLGVSEAVSHKLGPSLWKLCVSFLFCIWSVFRNATFLKTFATLQTGGSWMVFLDRMRRYGQ